MAIDQRKRQKRLAKQVAKRKEKTKKLTAKSQSSSQGIPTGFVSSSPIYECLMPENIFEMGIGNIIISRRKPNGNIAIGVFLVDVYCLGVKDAFFAVLSLDKYLELKIRFGEKGKLVSIDPPYARKFIEDAVSYALDLGFVPNKEYKHASMIFGNIDPKQCTETFTFGRDNKPCFVSGPNDSPFKCKQIMDMLKRRCGEGNFDFIIMA